MLLIYTMSEVLVYLFIIKSVTQQSCGSHHLFMIVCIFCNILFLLCYQPVFSIILLSPFTIQPPSQSALYYGSGMSVPQAVHWAINEQNMHIMLTHLFSIKTQITITCRSRFSTFRTFT